MFTQSGYQCLNWADMTNETVNPGTFPNSGKNCMIGKCFFMRMGWMERESCGYYNIYYYGINLKLRVILTVYSVVGSRKALKYAALKLKLVHVV